MSVNKVILVGNVGKDPEVRYIDQDLAVASFPLATTERGFTKRDGTQVPDSTEWHNIVAWRGLAKVAENYIVKGTQLYVEGKIRNRSYDDSNGVKRYITEIIADNIQMLGRKSDNVSSGTTAAPAMEKPKELENNAQAEKTKPFESDDSSEDDLPF